MKKYTDSSALNNDDLIKFAEKNVIEIGEIRETIKHIFAGEMEDMIQEKLNSQGIKTVFSTVNFQPDGEQTIHKNSWLGNGIVCSLKKEGEQWRQGKIKLKVEIEFEPNDTQAQKELNKDEVSKEEIKNQSSDSPSKNNKTIDTTIGNILQELDLYKDKALNELRNKLDKL